jgi:hypothetical protein
MRLSGPNRENTHRSKQTYSACRLLCCLPQQRRDDCGFAQKRAGSLLDRARTEIASSTFVADPSWACASSNLFAEPIMQALEASDLGCSCPPFCVSIHESGQRYKILEEVPCGRCIEPIITARCATYMVARYAACGNDDPLASEIQEIGTS